MVIGVIGASLSGLIAGKRLAEAGHDVTVIEKSRALGGRLATTTLDGMELDYGISHLQARNPEFKEFISNLEEDGDLKSWTKGFGAFNGEELYDKDPNADELMKYAGTEGNQDIARKLSRWVDVMSEEKAGGLTYLGPGTTKKRPWMINLTDVSVFECDAVILATPAVEAYGIIQTVQNRTATRNIIRHIDDVRYGGAFSLACTFDEELPDWRGINVKKSPVSLITNESSKRGDDSTGVVIKSTPEFYRKHAQKEDSKIIEKLLNEASAVTGSWIERPMSTYLHRWKYFSVMNPMDEYFLELEMNEAPLVLIGDYLGGNTVEDAYLSGYNLSEYWVRKFNKVSA